MNTQSPAQRQQHQRKQIERIAKNAIDAKQDIVLGTTTETPRIKTMPEDALPGQPTVATFVVNVRLQDDTRKVVRDVLVTNQAQQLIADAEKIPVQLRRDALGKYTVVGRASITPDSVPYPVDYYPMHDVGGVDLSYVFGVEIVRFDSLTSAVQTGLNAYRATIGQPALSASDLIMVDPLVYAHGSDYWPGYLYLPDAPRGGSTGTLRCRQEDQLVPWTDPRWRWGASPTGWGVGTSSWGLRELTVVCV